MAQLGERAVGRPVLDPSGSALVASRCPQCGDIRYPARRLCPVDHTECEDTRLDGHGSVYEAVQIHLAPPGFEAPLWVGYVDLDEGVRMFGQIRHDGAGPEPAHGDRVRMHVEWITGGDDPLVGPIFRKE